MLYEDDYGPLAYIVEDQHWRSHQSPAHTKNDWWPKRCHKTTLDNGNIPARPPF